MKKFLHYLCLILGTLSLLLGAFVFSAGLFIAAFFIIIGLIFLAIDYFNFGEKKISKAWLIVVGILFVLLIGLGFCARTESEKQIRENSESITEEETTIEEDVEASKFKSESVTVGPFSITIEEVTQCTVYHANVDTTAPEGYVFLVARLNAKNLTDEEQFGTSVGSQAYIDGVLQEANYNVPNYSSMTVEIFSGMSGSGNIIYQVPENWQTFQIVADPYYGDETFNVLTPEDVTIEN